MGLRWNISLISKKQITNFKQISINKMSNSKPVYDLEERTFQYAKRIRIYTKKLPKNTANIEDGKQLIRASESVGANYIEAKECGYFLRLIYETNTTEFQEEGIELCNEAVQLKKIFSAILEKSK
jgi:hypothetical protein